MRIPAVLCGPVVANLVVTGEDGRPVHLAPPVRDARPWLAEPMNWAVILIGAALVVLARYALRRLRGGGRRGGRAGGGSPPPPPAPPKNAPGCPAGHGIDPDREPLSMTLLRRAIAPALCLLAACGGGGGGGPAPQTFAVSAVVPANGATGVPRDALIRVTFDHALDAGNVPADAVRVGAIETGEVPGDVSLVADGTDRTLEFAPRAPLFENRTHTILVLATLRAAGGEALSGTTSFRFTTGAADGGITLPPRSALRATAGRLDTGRRSHTATLLKDGRVLLCGGYRQGTSVTDRAEIYDPATELFAVLPNRMRQGRAGHVAVRLLDGRVLIAGGWYEVSPGTPNTSLNAEVYDPVSGTFAATGNLGTARADAAALRLPDGRVLVTGGSRLDGSFLTDLGTAETYSPATGTWAPWPATMSHTRSLHGMADLSDGRFLLVGGSDADLHPETLDLATGAFAAFAPAAADRARFGPALARFASGNWIVCGGEAAGDVLYFDRPATRLVNSASPTTRPRAYATASPIGADRILVAGGIDFANGSFLLATCDLVVEGGVAGSETYATDVRFPTGMAAHTATVLDDGRILFAGGLNPTGGLPELDGAYLFTP